MKEQITMLEITKKQIQKVELCFLFQHIDLASLEVI